MWQLQDISLLITSPTGQATAMEIKKPQIRVGSADGNDVFLPANVAQNHAQLDFADDGVKVTALRADNVYLGNALLLPGKPAPWSETTVLRIGGYSLHLQRQKNQSPVEPKDSSEANSAQTSIPYSIRLPSTKAAVEPGNSVDILFSIINHGQTVDKVQIVVAGIPLDWLISPLPELHFMPDEEQEVVLTIQPSRAPASRAGNYPLLIQVAIIDPYYANRFASATVDLSVSAYHEFAMELHPQKVTSAGQGLFTVTLTNRGNTDLDVRLKATDPEAGCDYLFAPAQVRIASGQILPVPLTVQPKKRTLETKKNYNFTLRAQPSGLEQLSQQTSGEWIELPARLKWSWLLKWLWLLLITVVVIIIFFILWHVMGLVSDQQYVKDDKVLNPLAHLIALLVWCFGFVWWRRTHVK